MKPLFTLKHACGVFTALALLSVAAPAVRAEVIAADDASAYSGFTGAENMGTGFGAWVKTTLNNGGTFLDNTSADIRTGGKAWGLFANGGGTDNAVVYRTFNSSLAVGNSFTIKLDNNSVAAGNTMGFVLKSNNTFTDTNTYNSGSRFEYLFLGGDANYSFVENGGRTATTVGFRTTGQTVTVVITGANTFNLYLNDAAGTTSLQSITGRTFAGSGAITSFDIYNRNTEADQYFNSVSVYNPEYTATGGVWSATGNWLNSTRVLDGNNLLFAGAGGGTSTNDLSNADANFGHLQQINTLTFKAGAGAYTLAGNAINLNGGVTNSSSNLQTVNLNLTLGGAQTFAGGASGLQFGSAVGAGNGAINLQGNALTTSGTNTFNGVISGTGGSLSLAGTTNLNGANLYTGGTAVASGSTTNINNATALGTGALTFNGSATIDNTSAAAITLTNNNAINLSGGSLTFTGTKDLSFGTGAVTMNNANRSITVTNSGATLTVGSVAQDGSARALTKDGAGSLVINGASGYTGVTNLLVGSIGIGNNGALGTNTLNLGGASANTPTIFASGGSRTITNNVTLLQSTGGGNPTIAGSNDLTINGNVTNSGANRVLTVNNSGATTLGGSVFLSEASGSGRTLTINGSGSTDITGVIANFNGAGTAGNLTYSGNGSVTLSGGSPNTFSGTTTVTNGQMNLSKAGALGGTSGISVNNTGTLNLAVVGNVDRINNAATVGLGGGTFAISPTGSGANAILEGTGAQSVGGVVQSGASATGIGALTLNSNSTLDFGASGVGTLVFSSFNRIAGTLNILNYTTTADAGSQTSGTDGIDDRLIFNQDQTGNLGFFSFNGISATQIALGDGFFELAPIPEPGTWATGALIFVALLISPRKRFVRASRRS